MGANPGGRWTTQAACSLLMELGDRAEDVKFPIRDRADQFTDAFDAVLAVGIRVMESPAQASNANAICERMIATLRRELFDSTLILGERHLRQILGEYLARYNTVRPHRSLGGQFSPRHVETAAPPPINPADYRLRRRSVLGGLTSEYRVVA